MIPQVGLGKNAESVTLCRLAKSNKHGKCGVLALVDRVPG
jgi:hypothetical protein